MPIAATVPVLSASVAVATREDPLPPALLEAIAQRGNTRTYPSQSVLINEGDRSESLYILTHGRVKVYSAGDSGREVILTELGPGDYFGELSLDGQARSVSVKTLEAVTCCVVQGTELRAFLAEHPDFATHLTRKLFAMVRRLTLQVKSLALQDVYGRVVRVLLDLSQPVQDERSGQRLVRAKLTQQDIADRVGSSREMVNRIMKELTVGGYVTTTGEGGSKQMMILKRLPAAW